MKQVEIRRIPCISYSKTEEKLMEERYLKMTQ